MRDCVLGLGYLLTIAKWPNGDSIEIMLVLQGFHC